MKPVLLAIMDGFGLAPEGPGNAVSLANTPYLDSLFASAPHTSLGASGEDVGLPAGQMGNSEVGHLNIGAGRVIYQELSRINRAIADGSINDNPVLCAAIDAAIQAKRPVHLIGLVSDGGVHSHISHLEALVHMAAGRGARDIRIHCITDGRDVDPKSGVGFIKQLEELSNQVFEQYGGCMACIATICGRYYAMDRDKRWDRVKYAYDAIVRGAGRGARRDAAVRFMEASYASGETDEFIFPTVLDHRGLNTGDTVIFFNFRPDRARELCRALTEGPSFDQDCFDREFESFPRVVCLTEYDPALNAEVAFPKEFPANTLADVLAAQGLRQFHIAETEKYAHVTFFLNGGIEEPKEGEERCLIPSPKVATYDLQPQMSAPQVTQALKEAVEEGRADVYIVNYANCDMVGHTGSIPAAVQAVEAVDAGLSQVVEAVKAAGGTALITADHGNADQMLAEDGVSPFTAHSTARVPLILVSAQEGLGLDTRAGACLADIAPTLADIIGIEKPAEWTGNSLLTRS
ncbi:MAG: 2,3-bisphosphoglycerate-independent phosphoglycerate mutase [Coriobacteriales bacterium]